MSHKAIRRLLEGAARADLLERSLADLPDGAVLATAIREVLPAWPPL